MCRVGGQLQYHTMMACPALYATIIESISLYGTGAFFWRELELRGSYVSSRATPGTLTWLVEGGLLRPA